MVLSDRAVAGERDGEFSVLYEIVIHEAVFQKLPPLVRKSFEYAIHVPESETRKIGMTPQVAAMRGYITHEKFNETFSKGIEEARVTWSQKRVPSGTPTIIEDSAGEWS